jgi:two-component system CheB/CheR fusion protein
MASHENNEPDLTALLQYIHAQRGIDFGSYKEQSLRRRLQKRMEVVGIESFAAYTDFLQASPEEFTPLLDTVFINVTHFFRDREAWDVIRRQVIPRILGEKSSPASRIRVWCAGVASGEEPYSIAILLVQAMGKEEFQRRVKIYATDIDDAALARARQGVYTAKQVEEVPAHVRDESFDRSGENFAFRSDLRHCIVFGRHNLLQDAPISRLDLLICRNTLMYFNGEAQGKVLARFHFALRDEGFLFLGKAEMLLTRRNLFLPLDPRARIFTKSTQVSQRSRAFACTCGTRRPGICGVYVRTGEPVAV